MIFKHYKSAISEIIKEIDLDTFMLRYKNTLSLPNYQGLEKEKLIIYLNLQKEQIN
tara:strand:+ start:109 stop:276 length:168 start_codon:yes stop_codon:yes gene_type:complete